MKKVVYIILSLLAVSCGREPKDSSAAKASATPVSETPSSAQVLINFSIEPATTAAFDKAKEQFTHTFLQDTLAIKKKNGILKIPTEEYFHPFIVFTDTLLNTDDDEMRKYRYLGQFKEIQQYLVSGSFWEHYECYLIDKATGQTITTWSEPVLSPDKQFLANLSLPYGLEGIPNGIQVWHVKPDLAKGGQSLMIEKFLELDQQIWEPRDFVWETSNTILLQVTPLAYMDQENDMPSNTFQYLRLTLR